MTLVVNQLSNPPISKINQPTDSIDHSHLHLKSRMANFILFETTDSVIEVLWDIALAFFVVRTALLYAALTFGSTLAIALLFAPQLPQLFLPSSTTTTPGLLLLTSSALWARYIISRFEIPRVLGLRLAVGVVATLVVVLVEAVVGLVLYEADAGGWAREVVRMVEGAGSWKGGVGVLAGFAVMPAAQMVVERVREGERKGARLEVGGGM